MMQRPAASIATTLVTPYWLHSNLTAVRILDASWHLPATKRDLQQEFIQTRIPQAKRFDIDDIADKNTNLPHMLPPVPIFKAAAQALRFNQNTPIVVYDSVGVFSSPRVWYTLKLFGAKHVAVLDGGLPAWVKEGFPLDSGTPVEQADDSNIYDGTEFEVTFRELGVRDKEQVLENIDSQKEILVDARPMPRFEGTAPEPRPGLLVGHIPGSVNIPFDQMYASGLGSRMKSTEDLQRLFEEKLSVDVWSRPMVTTCGSGVTAAVVALGAHLAGKPLEEISLYDGSWSEWGNPAVVLPRVVLDDNKKDN